MRTRVLALAALFVVSADLSAQRLPLPRVGRRDPLPPTENPEPAAGPVARQLAITRSRWSLEGYTMVSTMHVPTELGVSSFTMLGTGTHGDYRLTDYWSSTMDVTVSGLGYGALWESFEPGVRYNFMPHDAELRPYVDLRGDFTHMYDTYDMPYGSATAGPNINGQNPGFYRQNRYSRGFGGVVGGGIEYTLTNTFSLNTGFNAMRNRMRIYDLAQPGTVPVGTNFWMTSYRYILGVRYNWIHTNHLSQNPLK